MAHAQVIVDPGWIPNFKESATKRFETLGLASHGLVMRLVDVPRKGTDLSGVRILVRWEPQGKTRRGTLLSVSWAPEKMARKRPRDLVDGFFGELRKRLEKILNEEDR